MLHEYLNQQKEKHQVRKEGQYQHIMRWWWRLTFAGLGFVALVFVGVALSGLPTFYELENPQSNLASEVLSEDGEVLGRYYIENRVPVQYEELSPNLVNALIATEDERYYRHAGIDGEALGRVLVRTIFMGQSSGGGGSTITQQLAKLLFPRPSTAGKNVIVKVGTMVFIKFKEWLTAVKLERRYTKDEIIALYLNKFDFINGAYGIKSAAETYFNVGQDSLSVEQAAVLVGMLKNPSLYNPVRFPERARGRRNQVIEQMYKNGQLDEAEKKRLQELPLVLDFKRKNHDDGPAPYFREEMRQEVKRILQELEDKRGLSYDVHTDGLRIHTTINMRMQEHAEAAAWAHLADLQEKFFAHWKDKDPWTYLASEQDKETRAKAFTNAVRASDRYQIIRANYMSDILARVQADFEVDLQDYDIERMLREEGERGHLDELKAKKLAPADKVALYKRILRSDAWADLKSTFQRFQKAADKSFSTKTKMTVFAYNARAEKDTVMTPYDSIRYHRMHLQTGMMVMEPGTGHIRAWVGGVNYKYFKYDHVNANTERQVGSAFKPFVYATAIAQQNISPCFKVVDGPVTIHSGEGSFSLIKDWTPKNSDGYSFREMTLYEALRQSKNTASAYLMKQLGSTDPVRELVDNLGIDPNRKNAYGQPRIPRQPSICLGAVDLSVYEMTGAYGAFANSGMYAKPIFITHISDRNGNVIWRAVPESKQALQEGKNYVVVDMMRRVVAASPGISNLKSDVGGKTGTTNNQADGWFMGITPQLVVGTWVGGDDRWIRFRSLGLGQGGRMARPIFSEFMKRVEADEKLAYDASKRFKMPERQPDIEVDCSNYSYGGEEEGFYNDGFYDDGFGDEAPAEGGSAPDAQEGTRPDEDFGGDFN